MATKTPQQNKLQTMGWLRAAVLGANDGIVSTASLIIGVAAAHTAHENILLAAVASLVAGGMSMATGEYISVYSQSDTEQAALAKELSEIKGDPKNEHLELTNIYIERGVEDNLAKEVARQLMAHDALGAHAHDELGISDLSTPKPLQAALASAASFATGASVPLAIVALAPEKLLIPMTTAISLISLAVLGALAAHVGGSKVTPSVVRVTFWSALAMGVTAIVGSFLGRGG